MLSQYYKKVIKQNLIPLSLLSGPKSWPVVGRIPEMMGNRHVFWWIHRILEGTKTGISCIRLNNVHVIPVTCPEISREILKKYDALFEDRPRTMASLAFDCGYISAAVTLHSEQWKKMRKVLTSEVIYPARHKWLHVKRVNEADNLVKYVFPMMHNQLLEYLNPVEALLW